MVTDTQLWKDLGAVADRADRAATAALRPHGLTTAQYELLDLLESMRCGCCGEGECRCESSYLCQNDITGRIDCTKGNVSGLVHRLTADGLISREPDPRDRRYNSVRITAKGRGVLLTAKPDFERTVESIFAPLPRADAEALRRLLETINPRCCEPKGDHAGK